MVVSTLPPQVGLRHGERTQQAHTVVLSGDRASVLLSEVPPEDTDVRLVLDWADGRITHLEARVTSVVQDARLARLRIDRVDGDWEPFLAWLGRRFA